MATPTDSLWTTGQQQAALIHVNAPTAWNATQGTADVVICVVSTGVARNHADLTVDPRWSDYTGAGTGGPTGVTAADALGTAMAGVAAATWDGGGNLAGVAGGGCKIVSTSLPAGFDAATDANKSSDMQQALDHVTTLVTAAGAAERWVVLLHPKQFVWSVAARNSLSALVVAGAVVVVPAGDDGLTTPLQYPANDPGVISVGAVDLTDSPWNAPPRASATGPGLTCAAPGVTIWATDLVGANGFNPAASPAGDYAQVSGTGIAAAFVAGAAALILSVNENLTSADVKSILAATASHPAAADDGTGYGGLDMGAAMAEALKVHGVVTTPSPLTFGSVATGLRAYATIHVERQNSTVTVGGNTFTVYSKSISFTIPDLGVLSSHLTYLDGTTGPKTIALALGDAPQDLVVRYTAPAPPDTPSGTLTVTTDDRKSLDPLYLPSKYPLPFSATAVVPPVVDVVLVIDHSGSMDDPAVTASSTKAQAAVAVANLCVTALNDVDHFGVVRFDDLAGDPDDVLVAKTHTTGTFAGLPVAGALGAARDTLRARLTTATADLAPRGSTSIGGGIKLGYDLLMSQSGTQRKNLIVVTDGLENTDPMIAAVEANDIDTSKVRIFGVGVGQDRSDQTLIDLSTVTNGYVLPTGPEASDAKLACILSQIMADAASASFALDPSGQLARGEDAVVEFAVSEADYRVDFTVLFNPGNSFPNALRIAFELPDGTVIRDNQVVAQQIPGAVVGGAPGHAIFKFTLPTDPAHPKRTVGTWKVVLTRPGKGDFQYDKKAGASQLPQDVISWSVMVTTRSDIALGGRISQTSTLPGTPMMVILEPTLGRLPIALDFDPTVNITRPDGVVRAVTLTRDVHGAYTNVFTDTSIPGGYRASADVSITSPSGVRVVRHREMAGCIVPVGGWGSGAAGETTTTGGRPGTTGGGTGGGGTSGGGTSGGGTSGGQGGDCGKYGPRNPHLAPLCCEVLECFVRALKRRC